MRHIAESRFEVLRERQRDLVRRARYSTADEWSGMIEKGVGMRGDAAERRQQRRKDKDAKSHERASEFDLLRRSETAAKQRPADRGRKHVVKIKVQLAEEADAGPTGAIDREHRFSPDLEVSAHPYHARIDGSDGDRAVAEIVGNGRCFAL
jgi:hypothetical protein